MTSALSFSVTEKEIVLMRSAIFQQKNALKSDKHIPLINQSGLASNSLIEKKAGAVNNVQLKVSLSYQPDLAC